MRLPAFLAHSTEVLGKSVLWSPVTGKANIYATVRLEAVDFDQLAVPLPSAGSESVREIELRQVGLYL